MDTHEKEITLLLEVLAVVVSPHQSSKMKGMCTYIVNIRDMLYGRAKHAYRLHV